jgi:biopolymer transport protein ExbD
LCFAAVACPTNVTIERWLNLFALDLLLVLMVVLVIYMAMTPILPHYIYVDVPLSTTAKPSPDTVDDLTISIPNQDFIAFGGDAIRMSDLEGRLASAPRDSFTTVRIHVARAVPFRIVRRVVEAARNAGYARVTFMVRRNEPAPGPFEGIDWMDWSCPPRYGEMLYALAFAAAAFAGVVALAAFRRKSSPGCAGWLLLVAIAIALSIAWGAAYPTCGWWY